MRSISKPTRGTDHRETADGYQGEVLRRGDLRIVLCRDGIQWIVQRRHRNAAKPGGAAWEPLGYCATLTGLKRVWPGLTGDEADLCHLPDYAHQVRRAKC